MPDDCLNPMANDAGWPHIATDLRAENARLRDDLAASERLRQHAETELGKESLLVKQLQAEVELLKNQRA